MENQKISAIVFISLILINCLNLNNVNIDSNKEQNKLEDKEIAYQRNSSEIQKIESNNKTQNPQSSHVEAARSPDISISNVRCTDSVIRFDYDADSDIPSDCDGGLTEIFYEIRCPSKSAWIYGSIGLNHADSKSGTISQTSLVHILWPVMGDWYTVGELYESGNRDIKISVTATQEYWHIWPFAESHDDSDSTDCTMVDDDTSPPTVTVELLYNGVHESYIQNGQTIDIHDIPYSESIYWTLKIGAFDDSGVQWKGLYGDESWSNFLGSYRTLTLKQIIDVYPEAELIGYGTKFKDLDNDHGIDDYSGEYILEFKLLRLKPWYAPSYEGLADIKIEGKHQIQGMYARFTEDQATTGLYDYKQSGEKTKVTFSFFFKNEEEYPIRIKFHMIIDYWSNILVELNEDVLYKFDEENSEDFYEGYLTPGDVFISDDKIDGIGVKDFWLEIPSGFCDNIDLFYLTIDSLVILKDLTLIYYQDTTDYIMEASNLISDWTSIFGDSSSPGAFAFIMDLAQDIEGWISLNNKLTNSLDNAGGGVNFLFWIEEAYVARKALDNHPYKWIWDLTRDDKLNNLDKPQHYSRDYDSIKLDNMIIESANIESVGDGIYRAGIGFTPSEDQQEALWNVLKVEITSDVIFYISHLILMCTDMDPLYKIFVVCSLEAIGAGFDFSKWHWIEIANGADPPDYNYYEKPNADKINFPYEDFPEIQAMPDSPFKLATYEFLDLQLENEKLLADLQISINRYNTAIIDKNYEAAKIQLDYRNEILDDITTNTYDLKEKSTNYFHEFELYTNNDPVYFTEEELNTLTLHDDTFSIDDRIVNFSKESAELRNIENDIILADVETTEKKINTCELDDFLLINKVSPTIYDYDYAIKTSESLKISNAEMNEYLSIEKLGEIPSSDEEISPTLNLMYGKLDILRDQISNGDYYNAIYFATNIKQESLTLYLETLRNEFFTILKDAEYYKRLAEQMNQIKLEFIDTGEFNVKNGNHINITVGIRNIVGDAILNKQDQIQPIIDIPNLPDYISFKLFHNNIELEKNSDGFYEIQMSRNEIKVLTLQISIEQNSPLELSQIPITLIAYQNTIEKNMYYENNYLLNILDDDETAPQIEDFIITMHDQILNTNFDVVDESGLSSLKILIDDEIVYEYSPTSSEKSFNIDLINKWIWDFGNHKMRVELTDADFDRIDDSLSSIFEYSFEITAKEMVDYTIWEMNELEEYIDHNVFFLYDWILIDQVKAAETKVQCALNWYNAGMQTRPIILDKLAKANLDLLEIVTTILDDWSLISEEDGDYISTDSHNIRDHITLSMGAIIGTMPALTIADNIVDIEQLTDQIFEEQNLWVALSIDVHLWEAADNLDNALITMSMDSSTITLILEDISKANLKLADVTTFLWEERGCIPESDSDYISETLHSIRDSITLTMGEIVGMQAATDISQIEIDIEQFADTIFEDYNLYTALSIDIELWTASEYLDLALITLSTGSTSGAETKLRLAIDQLENTKTKIISLKDSGYLTETQATQLNQQIDSIIAELTSLCDHTLNEGCEDGSTDTNLHGDTTESSGDNSDNTSGSGDTSDPNTGVPTH